MESAGGAMVDFGGSLVPVRSSSFGHTNNGQYTEVYLAYSVWVRALTSILVQCILTVSTQSTLFSDFVLWFPTLRSYWSTDPPWFPQYRTIEIYLHWVQRHTILYIRWASCPVISHTPRRDEISVSISVLINMPHCLSNQLQWMYSTGWGNHAL